MGYHQKRIQENQLLQGADNSDPVQMSGLNERLDEIVEALKKG